MASPDRLQKGFWSTVKQVSRSASTGAVLTRSQNPWVLLGAMTTATVLGSGLWAFSKGKVNMSQNMMVAKFPAAFFCVPISLAADSVFA